MDSKHGKFQESWTLDKFKVTERLLHLRPVSPSGTAFFFFLKFNLLGYYQVQMKDICIANLILYITITVQQSRMEIFFFFILSL